MDPVLVIMSKIVSYEGSSMSQCMRRSNASDGAREPSANIFLKSVELDARVGAEGGRGFGVRLPARIPNRHLIIFHHVISSCSDLSLSSLVF
jgi:hypothetical protein